jgi:MFS superfamily sulfate permease-like transporter
VGDVAKVSPSIPLPVWMNNDYDMPPINMETFNTVYPTALTISAVSLVESLITARFIAAKHKTNPKLNQEAVRYLYIYL